MANEHTTDLGLLHTYYEDLTTFLTHKLGSKELAADVAQETYLRMARLSPAVEIGHPRAFLFKVACNLVIDYQRREQRHSALLDTESVPTDMPSLAPSVEDEIHGKQKLALLSSAIAELPPKCREALLLNRLHAFSHAEIARKLGVSESMVAKYIARALKHCRNRLAQDMA